MKTTNESQRAAMSFRWAAAGWYGFGRLWFHRSVVAARVLCARYDVKRRDGGDGGEAFDFVPFQQAVDEHLDARQLAA
jgi:hypothetical protein